MAKLDDSIQSKRETKGNSSDTLLAIYVLRILKKYSSPEKPLSAAHVLTYLVNDYSICVNENADAQKKKIRRYLDTLHESYGRGCIRKIEGKSNKEGHNWYYDASRDDFAGEEGAAHETLSNEEIEFIIDIIASSKIINAESTRSIFKKLLKKTDFSKEKIKKKWKELRSEEWHKSINKELVGLRDALNSCMDDSRRIRFDYEGKKAVLATPYGWDSQNGKYVLIAKADGQGTGEFSSFLLDKIQNLKEEDIDWDFDDSYYDRQDKKPDDDSSLESLFANIRKINLAIEDRIGIEFKYLSYSVSDSMVVCNGIDRRVLPHKLVFADSKYYLIGYDEAKEAIDFYRVDLISQLNYSKNKIKISDWDARVLEGIQRAKEVEKHPLMLAEGDYPVTFKVVESALDRVIDAFAKRPEELHVTKETRLVRDSFGEGFHNERIVRVDVRTSIVEAYRWALANADAVEVTTQEIRDKIARVAEPIYQLYTQSMWDKVRENLDYIGKTGRFRVDNGVDSEIALATFKKLNAERKTDIVTDIFFEKDSGEPANYLGAFTNAARLHVINSPECQNIAWASDLSEIEKVELDETQIEDVSWLKGMSKLEWLSIYNSPVSDLSVLRDHSAIHTLHLSDTNVHDISFIENYQHLSWLMLVRCPITDYSPLLRLPSYLTCLEIDEKAARKIDLDKLRERHIGIDIRIIKDGQPWGW